MYAMCCGIVPRCYNGALHSIRRLLVSVRWRHYASTRLQVGIAGAGLHVYCTNTLTFCHNQLPLDYCNSILYGASAVHIRPLQNVLKVNAAARLILCKRKYDRITAAIRDLLHWLPVQQRIEYKMCVLVYKCLHQTAPIYLSELCIPVATSAGRSHLSSAVKGCLVISYCRTKNYGQRSFSYSGPALWNSATDSS